MADLRELLTGLGYTDVRTLLQSGNAVFTATGTPQRIEKSVEKAIADTLGLTVSVLVRSKAELSTVVKANRLPVGDPKKFLVVFYADTLATDAVPTTDFAPEAVQVGAREAYLWCPNGINDSPVAKAFTHKRMGIGTARNWNTVMKLLELVS